MSTRKSRADREEIDTFLLAAAFILGVGLAVGLKWLPLPVWVPALASAAVIVGYAVVTYLSSSARLEPEQIGDNCYYLGFCITLASLSWTLYGLGSASGDTALINDVISGFGVALSSTVVGVMARVILLQFRIDLAAREKEARKDLNQVMREFFGEMRATVASSTEMRTQIRQSLEEHTEQMIAQNVRMQESFESRIEKLVEDVGSGVQGAMDEIVDSGKDMNRRIAASSRSNTTSAEKAIIASMETVVADLKRAAGSFENGMGEANDQSVKALEKIVSEVSAAMNLLSEETRKSLQKASEMQSAETTRAIESVSANIFELSGEIGRQKDKVGEAIEEYTRETGKAREAMTRVSDENARVHEGARKSLDKLAGTARTIEQSAGRIEKAAGEMAKAAVNPTEPPATPFVAPLISLKGQASAGALKSGVATPGTTISFQGASPATPAGNAPPPAVAFPSVSPASETPEPASPSPAEAQAREAKPRSPASEKSASGGRFFRRIGLGGARDR